jgi:hypothetical protein
MVNAVRRQINPKLRFACALWRAESGGNRCTGHLYRLVKACGTRVPPRKSALMHPSELYVWNGRESSCTASTSAATFSGSMCWGMP